MNNDKFIKPPKNCIYCWKGVPREDLLFGKTVNWILFTTEDSDIVIDGWYGSSINWDLNNDDSALLELLTRRKGDKLQFSAGAVRIPKEEIDRIINQYEVDEQFTYELRKEYKNNFHGNLLFIDVLHNDRNKKRTICGALTKAVDISRRNY